MILLPVHLISTSCLHFYVTCVLKLYFARCLIVSGHDFDAPKHHSKITTKVENSSRHGGALVQTKYVFGVDIIHDHETQNRAIPEKRKSKQVKENVSEPSI